MQKLLFDSLDTSFHLTKLESKSKNTMLRFSGHDTFHCKEQWLLKGLQLIENQGVKQEKPFEIQYAIPLLGVGKNMVRSIQHWLKAFNLIDDKNDISTFGKCFGGGFPIGIIAITDKLQKKLLQLNFFYFYNY